MSTKPECSRSGDRSPRTKLRASARLAEAVSWTILNCSFAVSVFPPSRAFSADRPMRTMLEKPCARVSWISRASRSRSASMPASCCVCASASRVRRSSSATRRWFSASRNNARYARPVTTAKAAPNTGPSTMASCRPPSAEPLPWNHKAPTNSAVLSPMAGSARRRGSRWSCRKNSGKATQAKSALTSSKSSHSIMTAASHQRA
ncbi:hypothetical protein PJL18_01480 [Paenarthrobacter nicotinovorans]|nr:hypothetical protein [Paenarthrobacter nicotinovorans]